ncbi:MAG: DUF1833 family protein [Gammaproteobacteria bacterium]|nr:DUF1833 family protein [Gammaproteobacteria bacterium]
MAKTVTTGQQEDLNRIHGDAPLTLLEITHPDLGAPVRVVQDNQSVVHLGNTFVAMSFRIILPDDKAQGMPKATLIIDNVGKELVSWLETSNGGQGAQVRIIQVRRSVPDVVEWELTMDLNDVDMTMLEVNGVMGFDDVLNLPGQPFVYRPDTAPGVF